MLGFDSFFPFHPIPSAVRQHELRHRVASKNAKICRLFRHHVALQISLWQFSAEALESRLKSGPGTRLLALVSQEDEAPVDVLQRPVSPRFRPFWGEKTSDDSEIAMAGLPCVCGQEVLQNRLSEGLNLLLQRLLLENNVAKAPSVSGYFCIKEWPPKQSSTY